MPRGRDPRVARPAPRLSRTWPPTRPPSTPAATTPATTWSTGSPAPPATRSSTTAGRPWSSCATPCWPAAGRRAAAVSLRVIGHTRTFYDGDAFTGLPLGQLGDHGLPVRTETLAFTDDFLDDAVRTRRSAGGQPPAGLPRPRAAVGWTGGVPARSSATCCPPLAGYVHYADGERTRLAGRLLRRPPPGTATTSTTRHRAPRGLPRRVARPARRRDPDRLRPARPAARHARPTPAGLATTPSTTTACCSRAQVTDPTATPPRSTFSPAGLVTAQYVRGKDGEGDRDRPEHPHGLRPARLRRARPAGIGHAPIRRVHHDTETDVPADRARRRDRLGRVLRRVRPAAADPRAGRGHPVRRPALRRRRDPGRPDRTRSATPPGAPAPRPTRTTWWSAAGRSTTTRAGWCRSTSRSSPPGYDYAPPRDAQLGQKVTIFYDPRGQADPHRQPRRQRTARRLRRPGRPRRPGRLRTRRRGRPTPTTPTTTPAAPTPRHRQRLPRPLEHPGQHRGRRPRPHRHAPSPATAPTRRRLVHHPLGLRHPGQPRSSVTDALGRDGVPLRLRPGQAPLADGQHRRRPPRHRARRRSATPSRPATARARSPCAFDVLHRPIRVWARDDADRAR